MQQVFKRIALVAPHDAGVLITGESGTGKELVARAVHRYSARRDRPFLPVHIAALNPNLVESELFGHARGAFTGAAQARTGLLALADGGTVFLDELADIPLPVQVKLLRVLEHNEVTPVGATQPQPLNFRILTATNQDLARCVAEGRFRHDLYFRLNVFQLHLPPLRERPEDVEPLAEHFLRRFKPVGAAVAARHGAVPASAALVRQRPRAAQRPRTRRHPGSRRLAAAGALPALRDPTLQAVRGATSSRMPCAVAGGEGAFRGTDSTRRAFTRNCSGWSSRPCWRT